MVNVGDFLSSFTAGFVSIGAVAPFRPPKIFRANTIIACIASSVTRPTVKDKAAMACLPVVPPWNRTNQTATASNGVEKIMPGFLKNV